MGEPGAFDAHATVKLLLAYLLLAVPLPAAAQDDAANRMERFALLSDCQRMLLTVEGLSEDAADIGLTRDSLIAAAESRLRAARLYTDALPGPVLYVNVTVIEVAFSINLELKKAVLDPASGEIGLATTWDTGSTGTHGGDAGYVVNSVSQHLDHFLADYLRVNESACDAH